MHFYDVAGLRNKNYVCFYRRGAMLVRYLLSIAIACLFFRLWRVWVVPRRLNEGSRKQRSRNRPGNLVFWWQRFRRNSDGMTRPGRQMQVGSVKIAILTGREVTGPVIPLEFCRCVCTGRVNAGLCHAFLVSMLISGMDESAVGAWWTSRTDRSISESEPWVVVDSPDVATNCLFTPDFADVPVIGRRDQCVTDRTMWRSRRISNAQCKLQIQPVNCSSKSLWNTKKFKLQSCCRTHKHLNESGVWCQIFGRLC